MAVNSPFLFICEEPVHGFGDAASALSEAGQGDGRHLDSLGVGRVPGVSGLQLRDL